MSGSSTIRAVAGIACTLSVLSGCSLEPTGSRGEGPEPTVERTYTSPVESNVENAPDDVCPNGDNLRTLVAGRSSDINVNVSRVFVGTPDMDEVSYDEARADSPENYSRKFDPTRLLIAVISDPGHALSDDDLRDFEFKPISREDGQVHCEDQLYASVQFIGSYTPNGEAPVSIWEVTADTNFYSGMEVGYVSMVVDGAEVSGLPDPYVKRPVAVGGSPSMAERAPAFDDLRFYYENR